MNRALYLKEWLNWLWLRPENALMWTFRAEAYRNTLVGFENLKKIDVSCGDGVFSFVTSGGRLSEDTDMFTSVNSSQERKGNFDAYDFFDDSYYINIIKKPEFNFDVGTDWKQNLLKKANKLSFYSKNIQHDNNFKLPLEDDSFDYVFSNSTYWVQNYNEHIKDLKRITKPGGRIVLELKTTKIKEYTSEYYLPKIFGDNFFNIIDAGRMSTWKSLKTFDEYIEILEKEAKLKIEKVEPLYGPIVGEIWDIGLRPLFNPLVKLASSCDSNVRLSAKKEWVKICYELLESLALSYKSDSTNCFEWCVTAKKI